MVEPPKGLHSVKCGRLFGKPRFGESIASHRPKFNILITQLLRWRLRGGEWASLGGDNMKIIHHYVDGLKGWTNFSGTATRTKFWYFILAIILIMIGLNILGIPLALFRLFPIIDEFTFPIFDRSKLGDRKGFRVGLCPRGSAGCSFGC